MPYSINHLIIADSEKDSNLYYATNFLAPDPFIYLWINGKKIVFMSDLELDRAKAQARVDEVRSLSESMTRLKSKGLLRPGFIDVVMELFMECRVEEVSVPSNFPIEYADGLRERGILVHPKKAPFYEERMIKSSQEIQYISQTQRSTEEAVAKALDVIRESEIRGEDLYFQGKILTSEYIKQVLHISLMQDECIGERTIVSCAADGVDPHHEGSGPLKANQPIVLDVFPRSSRTRYYADMTRTIVRGRASDKLKRMYDAVLEGQNIAFSGIRDGANAKEIHTSIQSYFIGLGFNTDVAQGRYQGFFHGTGHGVGLDIHEPPRISAQSDTLKEGQVVTVEPGLYYLDAGGVRLEDMVVVTKEGCVNLTTFPKVLEI